MAAYNKFNTFVEQLAEKKIDLGSDVLKVLLTNSAPVATNAVKSDITEIAAGNGYTSGGNTATQNTSAQTSGTYKLTITDLVLTATGAVGPFRYAVLYSDTSTTDDLIGWWDYGSAVTLANGDTFTFDFDASAGVLTLA